MAGDVEEMMEYALSEEEYEKLKEKAKEYRCRAAQSEARRSLYVAWALLAIGYALCFVAVLLIIGRESTTEKGVLPVATGQATTTAEPATNAP